MPYDISKTCPNIHAIAFKPIPMLTFRAVSWFERIKPIGMAFQGIAEKTSLISANFGTTLQVAKAGLSIASGLKGIGFSFWNDQEEFNQTERRIYTREKEIYITEKNIQAPIRKRGNKTGSVKNERAMQATEKFFYDFIKEQERNLKDFTRTQIMFFVKERMKYAGLEDYFHLTHFKNKYAECPDVNHRPGNPHGQKDNPDIIMLVQMRSNPL